MRRAKPPNVVGRGPLLASPGFEVAIVCIVKDEVDYLEEWLAYHFALGIDHVFLYDNGSTDGSAALLEPLQNHGLVTVVDWPLPGGQLAAYNHALRFFGSSARWLAFYDVDEFLVPLADDDIPSFLRRFDDAADVRVERKEFGYSGHRTRPEGLTIDAYTQISNVLDLDPDVPPRVKSIVQPGAVSAVDVHLAFPADEPTAGAPTQTAEVEVRGVAQLNHYYTRSWEEFESKRVRGSATGRIDRPTVPFDLPTMATDDAARRYSDRTTQMIDRLRQLEPRPYTYGSELHLDFFPRPNDLGRFAEFAVANTAAGLTEPQRTAALKLRNRHDGIGLAADLSDTGYEPRPGGLATSVHTQVLVEHMRGRLELDVAAEPERVLVRRGELRERGATRSLALEDGAGLIELQLRPSERRRCHALGFVMGRPAPSETELRLAISASTTEGDASEPLTLSLPGSRLAAGVIEVQPSPQFVSSIELRFETAPASGEEIVLHDLFVISYG